MIAGNKIKLTLLGIFALGVVVGALGDQVFQAFTGRSDITRPEGRNAGPGRAIDMLTERLKLRPDQAKKVDDILDQAGQEYMKVRAQIRPQFDEIRKRQTDQIKAILDPQQQDAYNQLIREWEQRRRPPPPDHGRGK